MKGRFRPRVQGLLTSLGGDNPKLQGGNILKLFPGTMYGRPSVEL